MVHDAVDRDPNVTISRDSLVTLLRMAADTSGEPLAEAEREFLGSVMAPQGIDPDLAGIELYPVDDTPFEF